MAKGKLTAEEMYNIETSRIPTLTRESIIKLMRNFAKQETKWWSSLCNKWETAYKGLLKDTEI